MSRTKKNRRRPDLVEVSHDKRALSVPCATCGKRRYPNRKAARAFAKKRWPGDHMSTYRCGQYWHLGHIPWEVKLGEESRDSFGQDHSEAG